MREHILVKDEALGDLPPQSLVLAVTLLTDQR